MLTAREDKKRTGVRVASRFVNTTDPLTISADCDIVFSCDAKNENTENASFSPQPMCRKSSFLRNSLPTPTAGCFRILCNDSGGTHTGMSAAA